MRKGTVTFGDLFEKHNDHHKIKIKYFVPPSIFIFPVVRLEESRFHSWHSLILLRKYLIFFL